MKINLSIPSSFSLQFKYSLFKSKKLNSVYFDVFIRFYEVDDSKFLSARTSFDEETKNTYEHFKVFSSILIKFDNVTIFQDEFVLEIKKQHYLDQFFLI